MAIRRGISANAASKLFKIPRRTLDNKVIGRHTLKYGAPTVSSEIDERRLVDVLIACAEYGSPLTMLDLRMTVRDFLAKNSIVNKKFRNNMPGEDWCYGFLKRHSHLLNQRHRQNIKKNRAEKNENEIEEYFANLEKKLRRSCSQ
ncbi:hypothetical protein NQ314_001090 [Rhamnusium bicolor]|uniref:Transposase n=1 Tax=Rhamnusium bicolor TaxID=1586634 RepID=A0AAV8ZUE1_9CUCU|nr:hypothetical protein NQ314_001090 [Rhamnusium bicolor]